MKKFIILSLIGIIFTSVFAIDAKAAKKSSSSKKSKIPHCGSDVYFSIKKGVLIRILY